MEGPRADSEEKREPVSDIDIAVVDSLKVLDPNRPIREAELMHCSKQYGYDRLVHERAASVEFSGRVFWPFAG